jgi:hypothetical protein
MRGEEFVELSSIDINVTGLFIRYALKYKYFIIKFLKKSIIFKLRVIGLSLDYKVHHHYKALNEVKR